MLAQYGDPGPEYGRRINGNAPYQPNGNNPAESTHPDDTKCRTTPLANRRVRPGLNGDASKIIPVQSGASIANR